MPFVSVIMSVYNEPLEILTESIESVLNQTYTDFEFIIVIDNPNFLEARFLIESFAKKDNRIKFFVNKTNLGLSKSLNKAISIAKGTYIARMDADDISISTRLEKQICFLQKKNVDLVGSFVQTISEDGTIISDCIKVPVKDEQIKKKLKINNCIFHPTWFLKKEIYEFAGGYNLFQIEDYELLLKCKDVYKFGNVPEVLLKYRMMQNSISRSSLFLQYIKMLYLQEIYFKKGQNKILLEDFIKKKYTDKKAKKFAIANNYFVESLKNLEQKHYFSFVKKIFMSFFISADYAKKMIRYILAFTPPHTHSQS